MEADELLFFPAEKCWTTHFWGAHKTLVSIDFYTYALNSEKLPFWPFLTINLPLKAKQGISKADGKIEQDLHILLDEYATQYTKTMCNLMT